MERMEGRTDGRTDVLEKMKDAVAPARHSRPRVCWLRAGRTISEEEEAFGEEEAARREAGGLTGRLGVADCWHGGW